MKESQKEQLLLEIKKLAAEKNSRFLSGLKKFEKAKVKLNQTKSKIVWRDGSSRLLFYPPQKKEASVILFIPSLINRSYILDIDKNFSLINFLKNNTNCLLLDWGVPGKFEKDFGLDEYVNRAASAIKFARENFGKKIILAGYCMGGLIALSAVISKNIKPAGLVFFSSPWDFHAKGAYKIAAGLEEQKTIEDFIEKNNGLSSQQLQLLFYMRNMGLVHEKFRNFTEVAGRNKKLFMLIETWVNDGVAITRKVAKECILGWGVKNSTQQKQWKINGKIINPEKINVPALFFIPKKDKVVPLTSSKPLAEIYRNKKIIYPNTGHVGMIVGKNAKKEVWLQLANWINKL